MNGPGHRARKRFGQNFLVDANLIGNIVAAIGPQASDRLVEIGPGQGALTEPLLQACPQLSAVEVDRDLAAWLRQRFAGYPDFHLIEADALTLDFRQLPGSGPLRVVGNLPYNISTPLLFHLLTQADAIADMHFMLQKEVVDRLAAAPGSKDYGRLSVMVQYRCQVTPLLAVPPGAFRPAPKVDSAVVRLTPHSQLPHLARDFVRLQHLVKISFGQRRKTLRNSIKAAFPGVDPERLPGDLSRRPETLSVAEFVTLSNALVDAQQH